MPKLSSRYDKINDVTKKEKTLAGAYKIFWSPNGFLDKKEEFNIIALLDNNNNYILLFDFFFAIIFCLRTFNFVS